MSVNRWHEKVFRFLQTCSIRTFDRLYRKWQYKLDQERWWPFDEGGEG